MILNQIGLVVLGIRQSMNYKQYGKDIIIIVQDSYFKLF